MPAKIVFTINATTKIRGQIFTFMVVTFLTVMIVTKEG
jgi:hypothetical protein